ncbi:MoaD/ThiS family protein [Candidatus Bathyarchaeota archaeon]|nr:MoaD/ThiS family protein [Candidatus Bathyarchaeota archaeon]
MAKIKLKILGSLQRADIAKEDTLNVENISEIIQRIESRYPQDYYFTYDIFLNGISVADKSKNLRDGDEVVIVPIMSGG